MSGHRIGFVNKEGEYITMEYNEWWNSLSRSERLKRTIQQKRRNTTYTFRGMLASAIQKLANSIRPSINITEDDGVDAHRARTIIRRLPIRGRQFIFICPICLRLQRSMSWRRRNAAYCDDWKNWLFSCTDCWQADTDQLQDQWDEYYSMVM